MHYFSYKETYPTTSSTVQMVQYSDTNSQPVTTLKSLKDPNCLLDNISMRSQRLVLLKTIISILKVLFFLQS